MCAAQKVSWVVALSIALAGTACGSRTATDGCVPSSRPAGRDIAFFSDRTGHGELYVTRADGTGTRRLTRAGAVQGDELDAFATLGLTRPQWSPDGRKILFRSGNGGIVVLGAAGDCRQRLVGGLQPAWSPDGKTIAFASGRRGLEIHLVDADGSHERTLVDDGLAPTWSPDGTTIAFERRRGEGTHGDIYDVWAVGTDGHNEREVAKGAHLVEWSRDGASLLLLKPRGWTVDVYVSDAAGHHQRLLARDASSPAWSPDGKLIAYVATRHGYRLHGVTFVSGTSEIAVVRPDGTDRRWLTAGDDGILEPAWSSDSKRIAFSAEVDRGDELFVVNATGTGQRQLTHNDATDTKPSWRPASPGR